MIVSFSVSYFRSFSSEENFSLVAGKRLSASHEQHALPIPDSDERVLRTGVLYGANGAGKSNLFKALRYLRSVAKAEDTSYRRFCGQFPEGDVLGAPGRSLRRVARYTSS